MSVRYITAPAKSAERFWSWYTVNDTFLEVMGQVKRGLLEHLCEGLTDSLATFVCNQSGLW